MAVLFEVEALAEYLPFVMDDGEEREATGALEDLSDDARFYGSDSWEIPEVTPQPVINLVRRAAVRHMKNHEGFTQSRAGDETVTWTDRGEQAGAAYFTAQEKDALRGYAGHQKTLTSAVVTAYRTRPRCEVGWVPSEDGADFPYYASEDGPW